CFREAGLPQGVPSWAHAPAARRRRRRAGRHASWWQGIVMPRVLTADRAVAARPVQIGVGAHTLDGDLTMPPGATGLVVFAHGSGSGRNSPRNRLVAGALIKANMATLVVDLLTDAEEGIDEITEELRFDIPFL